MKNIKLRLILFALLISPGLIWARADIGINISWPADWTKDRIFTDVMKTARQWYQVGDWGNTLASVDSNGWPTQDAMACIWANDNMQGTYQLSFTGDSTVTVQFPWASATLQNVTYNAGTWTADMIFTYSDSENFAMQFTNTNGKGVKNISLMRPTYPSSTVSYAAGSFVTDQFKAAIALFSTIRYMGFMETDANPQKTWSDRTPPDYSSFNSLDGGSLGASWECLIQIANQTGKDAWINVPSQVDDNYIQNLANLFMYGSDANGTPYTATQPSPVHPPLNPNLNLYIEYTNEFWNWAYPYSVDAQYLYDNATTTVATGDPYHLNFDNCNNNYYWAWRYGAKRAADISAIFRGAFGAGQMMARIRPVLCWQEVNGDTGMQELNYIEGAYDTTRAVSYYFYGGGGAAYYNPDHSSGASFDINTIWNSDTMNVSNWVYGDVTMNAEICSTFGMTRTSYEGGPSLDKTGNSTLDAVQAAAVNDSRMETNVVAHHNAWSTYNGSVLNYLCLTGDYQWGFTTDVLNLNTPKLNAIADLSANTPEALDFGNFVPAIVDGGMFHWGFQAWYAPNTGPITISSGEWRSYLFDIPMTCAYAVSATANYTGTAGSLAFIIDGGVPVLATDTLGSSSQQTPAHYVTLTKGLHSIRLKAMGGGVKVTKVYVSANITDTTPPTAPANLAGCAVSTTQIDLSWNAATDNNAVSYYKVFRNGIFIGSTAAISYSDTGLTTATAYNYTVVAVDICGNTGPASASVNVKTQSSTFASNKFGINSVVAFPDPYNRTKGAGLNIKYTLTQDADEVYAKIYSSGLRLVCKIQIGSSLQADEQTGVILPNYLKSYAPGLYYFILIARQGGKEVKSNVMPFLILK